MQICVDIQDSVPQVVNRIWCLDSGAAVNVHLAPSVCRKMRPWKQSLRIIVTALDYHGPGSSVGIATGYGLGGPGIESPWGRDSPHLSRPALGPTQPPVQWVPGFPGGKERPGRDAKPSSPSRAVVMKG